jgi:DNA-binding MltR family transcriptional regulator
MAKRKVLAPAVLSADTQKVFDVLNDGSDLACVLIGTSFLDECLRSLLRGRFVDATAAEDLLNPSNGALGTLAARREVAYCLGLISGKQMEDIRTVGKIRNAFAHSHLAMAFADRSVMDLAGKLESCDLLKPTGLLVEVESPTPEQKRVNARRRFVVTVVLLGQYLLVSGHTVRHAAQKGRPKQRA